VGGKKLSGSNRSPSFFSTIFFSVAGLVKEMHLTRPSVRFSKARHVAGSKRNTCKWDDDDDEGGGGYNPFPAASDADEESPASMMGVFRSTVAAGKRILWRAMALDAGFELSCLR